RKAILGTVGLFVLGTFVFGRDIGSYMRTGASSVRQAVKAEVPLEFEVERARKMVEDLVPDIRNCMHIVAEQQVDIEYVDEHVAEPEAQLAKQKDAILALRSDLTTGDERFVYASHTYTADEVKRDLAQRFERYKGAEETLKRDRQILQAREAALN